MITSINAVSLTDTIITCITNTSKSYGSRGTTRKGDHQSTKKRGKARKKGVNSSFHKK